MEARRSKLHLNDCPDSLQRLARRVAEDFQNTATWPTADDFHLQREDFGVTQVEFNSFGHAMFDFHAENGIQTTRLKLWAMFDTGLFSGQFSDAQELVAHAFSNIKATKKAVTVTRDNAATRIGRPLSDRYVDVIEYIFSRSVIGYQRHPDHGWELVIGVQQYSASVPSIDDLFLQRPSAPSNIAATEVLVPRGALLTDASGLASINKPSLIFVSCGQVTPAEIKLGKDICALIDAIPGLTSYFAQNVTSPEALSSNIFRNLNDASGVIAVMHHRGTVTGRPADAPKTRASVWIEQEIAIAAFMTAVLGRQIHLAAYSQRGLSREGVRDNLILNPVDFTDESEVLDDVRQKIASWGLVPPRPVGPHVALDMRFTRLENSDGERHVYELRVKMTNASTDVIGAFDATLDFPAAFVLGAPGTIGMERLDLAHDGYRVFRHDNFRRVPLLPGDDLRILTLPYQVTTKLYEDRAATFALPVVARVYVDGRLAGEASKLFRELQEF